MRENICFIAILMDTVLLKELAACGYNLEKILLYVYLLVILCIIGNISGVLFRIYCFEKSEVFLFFTTE